MERYYHCVPDSRIFRDCLTNLHTAVMRTFLVLSSAKAYKAPIAAKQRKHVRSGCCAYAAGDSLTAKSDCAHVDELSVGSHVQCSPPLTEQECSAARCGRSRHGCPDRVNVRADVQCKCKFTQDGGDDRPEALRAEALCNDGLRTFSSFRVRLSFV